MRSRRPVVLSSCTRQARVEVLVTTWPEKSAGEPLTTLRHQSVWLLDGSEYYRLDFVRCAD